MTKNSPTILGALTVVTGGQTAGYVLSTVRTIMMARLLSRADFGLAATFTLAVAALEMTNRLGVGRQVVQAKDGDSQSFLNVAHTFQMLAGVVNTAVLVIMCVPMAYLFKAPDKVWAFALLALIPMFRGLENLDFQSRQRRLEFMPFMWVELVPQTVVTAAAWPLLSWLHDFRAVLILFLGKELLTLLMTHVLAQRSYRYGWNKALVSRMWSFGWPLVLNGFFMFLVQQGDKTLVGTGYTLGVLALYSAGATLVMVPFRMVAQAVGSVMLPVLSRLQEDHIRFNKEYQVCIEIVTVTAVVTMVPLVIGGEQILTAVYGSRYTGGGIILALLAAGGMFRILRTAPAIAATALADTKNQMISNLFGCCSLVLGVGAVLLKSAVEVVAACGLIGEIIAFTASNLLLKHRHDLITSRTIKPAFYLTACLTGAVALGWFAAHNWTLLAVICADSLFIACTLIVGRVLFPESFNRIWREVTAFFGQLSLKKNRPE